MNTEVHKALMTAAEASALLRVHPKTIYAWAKKCKLPALNLNGKLRFKGRDLDEFINSGKAPLAFGSPPKVKLPLDAYDRIHLKGGASALSKNARRWRYGFGAVYLRKTKRGNDRWCIDYRGPQGQRVREVVGEAQSRGEALAALQGKVIQVFDGKFEPSRNAKSLKFGALADMFMTEYAKPEKKSWRTDEFRLRTIKKHLGEFELARITPAVLREYRQARLDGGRSPLTANRELALIKKIFSFAIERGLATENPARKVKMFSEKDTARDRTLSPDEQGKLFAELAPHLRPIVIVALHTGLRYRELLSLRWSDINLDKRTIRVENTKSKCARFIPLNSVLCDELSRMRAERRGSANVFPFKNVRTGFESACRRAKVEGFTFHDLRRTFGTRLLEKGVNIVTISRLYGHSSVLVTQRYLHPSDELSVEAVELLAGKAENGDNLSRGWHADSESKSPELPLNRSIS